MSKINGGDFVPEGKYFENLKKIAKTALLDKKVFYEKREKKYPLWMINLMFTDFNPMVPLYCKTFKKFPKFGKETGIDLDGDIILCLNKWRNNKKDPIIRYELCANVKYNYFVIVRKTYFYKGKAKDVKAPKFSKYKNNFIRQLKKLERILGPGIDKEEKCSNQTK